MDEQFHPTLYWACDELYMFGLKLNHVIKRDPYYPKNVPGGGGSGAGVGVGVGVVSLRFWCPRFNTGIS